VPLFAILAGAILAWCGWNGLSALTVVDKTMRGEQLPGYTKGSGLTDLAGPLIGYELLKASLSGGGLSKLLGAGGGGEGAGKGDDDGGDDGGGDDIGGDNIPEIPADF
jgi:hypothetical protein